MGKSQKFVNVRREQVMLDEHGMPTRPPPEYNPLRPEASGEWLPDYVLVVTDSVIGCL